jgi:hypothetical protein
MGAQLEAGTKFSVDASCATYQFDVQVHLLDGTTGPLPTSHGGVLACPPSAFGGCLIGAVDGNGHVSMPLRPNVTYTINGTATNMDGWNCPGYQFGDTKFWFSTTSVNGTPDLANGSTFIVNEPNCFTFRVLDGNGNPFGQAGMWAVPVGGGAMVFGNVDASGVATFTNLDPSVAYSFTAYAINTGWGCPGYTAPDGTTYNFAAPVQGNPADLQGTTFTIARPPCYEFHGFVHTLDGTSGPIPSDQGGILACRTDNSGCVSAPVDANGDVRMSNLDPTATYTINAYVVNMPGWSCGWTGLPPDIYWFSNQSATGTPDTANGMTFDIYQPAGSSCGA